MRCDQDFLYNIELQKMLDENSDLIDEDIIENAVAEISKAYESKMADVPEDSRNDIERSILLQLLDTSWKDHLSNMDHLRQGIHLRGYAQKNPTQEYKRESFNLFTEMISQLKYDVISTLAKIDIVPEQQVPSELHQPTMHFQHDESQLFDNQQDQAEQGMQDEWHTYWKSPGDIGLATDIKWTVPDGVATPPYEFPIPHRYFDGISVSYGYGEQVMFFTEVVLPQNTPPGDVTLGATAT